MKGWFILKCVVLGLIFASVIGLITMYLWNWLVPDLFNGPEITYWKALGLLVLTKILFWGFGGKRHHYSEGEHPWKRRFANKFSNMTPEEREAMKQKMKEKWCSWEKPRTGGDKTAAND
jgi:hypothetical protein